MNKKAFTLAELLGVIVVLGVIAIIATPAIQKTVRQNREKMYNVITEQLIDSAKDWAAKNSSKLPQNDGDSIKVNLAELKQSGLLQISVVNPKNNKTFSNQSFVTITKKFNNYTYEVTTFDLVNADEVEVGAPTMTLNGSQVINLNVGNSYSELGATSKNSNPCVVVNGTGNNVGDEIVCGTEYFYVISNNGNKIDMLAAKGINADTSNPIQSDSADMLAFSSTAYWNSTTSTYPAYVYDSSSNLYQYVEAYETYLKNIGVDSADASLMSYEQATALGCVSGSCLAAPSWVYSSTCWLGSAYGSNVLWSITSDGGFYIAAFEYANYVMRPVITISTDELDSNISIQILKNGKEVSNIDTSTKGTYTVYYSLAKNGLLGLNIRTVIVK